MRKTITVLLPEKQPKYPFAIVFESEASAQDFQATLNAMGFTATALIEAEFVEE
jgi:hypothetical protein